MDSLTDDVLFQTSDKMLSISPNESSKKQMTSSENSELSLPPIETIRRLNELATSKLAEMIRKRTEKGYDDAEIVAARALLDKSTQPMQR